ncbi:hypothetical protein ACFXHA_27305 [Nocardia sp. NPDC059240]|uniref:hypothetical protein n=1 Tax=Nocardia sp. NPDC059240 TaxID=3346786 RepID=UPI0036C35E5D
MIASTPVARWVWGRDHEQNDIVELCLGDVLLAHQALVVHRLGLGAPLIHVRIHEAGHPRNLLLDSDFASFGGCSAVEVAERLARLIRELRGTGEIGFVRATIDCVGEVGGGGSESVQKDLFRLTTAAFEDYVTTSLVTNFDVWMPHDLRGRPQPTVYAANQPRLAAALLDISKVLATEIDPGELTRFGRSTESGVDNLLDPAGTPSNVWDRYDE